MALGKLTVGLLATAYSLAANAATYDLAAGETLSIEVDQDNAITVAFAAADFVSIGAATANEVCAVLNRAFAQDEIPANATVVGNAVQINSNDDGQVIVTGGTAASVFGFVAGSTAPSEAGAQPSAPTFHDLVSLPGDSAYAGTGGTTGFLAAFQAATKSTRAILAILAQDCGGYLVSYAPATDKLKVWETTTGAPHVLIEVAGTTDLSGTTFNILVISQ
jgi:hypothetical protein